MQADRQSQHVPCTHPARGREISWVWLAEARTLALVLLLLLLLSPPARANEREHARLLQEGATALNANRLALAATRFGQAARMNIAGSSAGQRLAEVCRRAAEELLERPAAASAVFHRAIFYGDSFQARRFLEESIRASGKDPRSFTDRVKLAELSKRSGDIEGAVVEYSAALALKDDPGIRVRLAEVLRCAGLLESATSEYSRVLEMKHLDGPILAAAWEGLGQCRNAQHDYTGACQAFRRSDDLRKQPDSPSAIEIKPASADSAPESTAEQQDPTNTRSRSLESEDLEERVKRHPSDATAHFRLGLALEQSSKLDDAIAEFRLATSLDRDNQAFARCLESALSRKADPVIESATAAHEKGDYALAIKLYEQAAGLVPDNSKLMFNLASVYFARGQFSESLVWCQRLKEKQDAEPEVWWLLGRLQDHFGRGEEAIIDYQRYLDLVPKGVFANQAAERRSALAKDHQATLRICTADDTRRLARADELYNAGVLLQRRGRMESAESKYRESLHFAPGQADCWFAIGTLRHDRGDLSGAISAYERAAELDPVMPTYQAALQAARHARARKLLESAYHKQTTPDSKGRIDYPAAIADYELALGILPDARGYMNLGLAYQSSREYNKARASYEKALSLESCPPDAHFYLSQCLEALDQRDRASAQLKKYLQATRAGGQKLSSTSSTR